MEYEIKKGTNMFYIGESEMKGVATIIWTEVKPNVISVDSTFVAVPLRGKGIAAKLLKKVLEMARDNQLKIIPNCSYVDKYMNRTDEFNDLLYKK
jgi:predicted GNAT family acetyltransferase